MRSYILCIILLLSITACKKENEEIDHCATVACTLAITYVELHFTNTVGDSIVFDDYYTTRVSTGEVMRLGKDFLDRAGTYKVLSDGYKNKLNLNTEEFKFTGVKDGKVIAEESIMITGGCCGVFSNHDNKHIVLP